MRPRRQRCPASPGATGRCLDRCHYPAVASRPRHLRDRTRRPGRPAAVHASVLADAQSADAGARHDAPHLARNAVPDIRHRRPSDTPKGRPPRGYRIPQQRTGTPTDHEREREMSHPDPRHLAEWTGAYPYELPVHDHLHSTDRGIADRPGAGRRASWPRPMTALGVSRPAHQATITKPVAHYDLSWVRLVHTWPPEEQSRASRKASSGTPKSLTCTGAQDAAILVTHTHRGISPFCGRKFSAQIRSLRAANSQVSALRGRSRPKRDRSRARSPSPWHTTTRTKGGEQPGTRAASVGRYTASDPPRSKTPDRATESSE